MHSTRLYFLLILSMFFITTGCTHLKPAGQVMIAQGVQLQLVLPTQHGTTTQLVTGTYRKESHPLVMQNQSSSNQFTMVGLTPTGTRLFTALYDGHEISSWRSPLFTAPFDGSYLIADFLLATLDINTLNQLLTHGSASEQSVNTAVERNISNSEGTPVIHIVYSNPSQRDAGVVDYCHLERHYCLHIETLEVEKTP